MAKLEAIRVKEHYVDVDRARSKAVAAAHPAKNSLNNGYDIFLAA